MIKHKRESNSDIGIISYNINTLSGNFGAALHSFAFQKYLQKIGINSVIIDYKKTTAYSTWKTLRKNVFLCWLKYIAILYKRYRFRKFFEKHCIITENKYTPQNINTLDSINKFCCETDVTWCGTKDGKFDRAFMCDLENMKGKENIAYSVDFGSGELNDIQKSALNKYAKNFKAISIRNPFRLEEFKEVIERDDVIVALDPVFLINKEDYEPIIKKPQKKEPYVLVYHCKERSANLVKQAKKFAKEHKLKLKIINCFDVGIKNYIESIPTPIGIEEFLGEIQNCEYFFTNSYHGICFAIILQKQFYAFARRGNDDKIQTVLSLFDLMDRKIDELPKDIKNIDYSNMEQQIKEQRKESEDFIKKVLTQK